MTEDNDLKDLTGCVSLIGKLTTRAIQVLTLVVLILILATLRHWF